MFPGKMDLANQLTKYNLESVKDIILSSARPAVVMSRTAKNDDEIEISASKFGGNPDLPPDFEWQYYQDTPLTFIGQFNLSEMPGVVFEDEEFHQKALWDMDTIRSIRPDSYRNMQILPDKGMLYFFCIAPHGRYLTEDKTEWNIAYTENTENLQRRLHPEYESDRVAIPLPAHQVHFHSRSSIPVELSPYRRSFFSQDMENTYYWYLFREHYPFPRHHFYGYPATYYGRDIGWYCVTETQKLEFEGEKRYQYSEEQEKYITSEATKWQFLFQIDTDNSLEVMWGELGTLYVCIPKLSLEAKKFEDCWIVNQSH